MHRGYAVKKMFIVLSVGLNVLVLAVVLFMMAGGASKLATEYFVKPSHNRWVSQFELLPVQPGDTVFLGDSITEGGSWHELLPDQPVRNRGIGGDTTTGVIERLHQIAQGKPDKVFLLIGTNDLFLKVDAREIVANIESIVDSIRGESPATRVIVQSVLPRAASYRDRIEALNDELRSAIADKASWLDLYPLFLDGDTGGIRGDLSNDRLHLSGPGYLLWRDALREWLDDMPGSP